MTIPTEISNSELFASPATIWGAELQPAGCPRCKQVFLVPSGQKMPYCPTCARAALEPQPALLRREAPELGLPSRLTSTDLNNAYAQFCRGVWLSPEDFSPTNLSHRAALLFWPMWLVDCDVTGVWQAEIGFDYQVQSSEEAYLNNQWQSRAIVETRVRWEPRQGQIDRRYQNSPCPAVSDQNQLAQQLGAYPIQHAQAYSAQMIDHAILRLPNLPPDIAWPYARPRIEKLAAEDVTHAADGQHIRNFSLKATYNEQLWTQLLLPVYVSYYTDDDGVAQLVSVNAVTGAVSGHRLASQKKGWRWAGVAAVVAVVAFLISLVMLLTGSALPALAVVGTLGMVFAIGTGLFAIVPAVWPWYWNRGQQPEKIVTVK